MYVVFLPYPVCVPALSMSIPIPTMSPLCPSRGFSPEHPQLPQLELAQPGIAQTPLPSAGYHNPPAVCCRAPSPSLLLPPQLLNCIMDMVEKTRRSLTVLRRCQEADREELNHWIRRYSDAEDMKKGSPPSARPHNSSSSTTEAPQLGTAPGAACGGCAPLGVPALFRSPGGLALQAAAFQGMASPKGVPSLLHRRSPGLHTAAALRVHARGDLEESW